MRQTDAKPEMDDFDLMTGGDMFEDAVQTAGTVAEDVNDEPRNIVVFEMNYR